MSSRPALATYQDPAQKERNKEKEKKLFCLEMR
jgi:hypothetical protein